MTRGARPGAAPPTPRWSTNVKWRPLPCAPLLGLTTCDDRNQRPPVRTDLGEVDDAATADLGRTIFLPGTFGADCAGSQTVLTGTVLAPNGKDPVAAARVHVVDELTPLPEKVNCDVCGQSVDQAKISVTTATDGTFSLQLDALAKSDEVKLVVAKGRFRRMTEVPVDACGARAVAASAVTLPARKAEGDLPRIAVATGNQDHLDVVLEALGIREMDCYTGTANPTGKPGNPCAMQQADISALLGDAAKLAGYHMVFIGCAPGQWQRLAQSATLVKNLEAWVRAGGRLFVTDMSYNYVEQTFPPRQAR